MTTWLKPLANTLSLVSIVGLQSGTDTMDKTRIAQFDQTMVELRSARKRAAASGLATKFHKRWEQIVSACWCDPSTSIEDLSPMSVYMSIVEKEKKRK